MPGWAALDLEDPADVIIFQAAARKATEITEKRMADTVARGIARAFRKG